MTLPSFFRSQSPRELVQFALEELALLRRGLDLAERRERHPSYRMELQAVIQTADLCRDLLQESLAARTGNCSSGTPEVTEDKNSASK
jgi:hypothetical protein